MDRCPGLADGKGHLSPPSPPLGWRRGSRSGGWFSTAEGFSWELEWSSAGLTGRGKNFRLATRLKTFTWHFRVWLLPLAFISGVELTCVAGQREQNPNLDAYRKYALTHEGDVARGAQLFADEQRLDCVKCHTVDGSGGKAGPDLFAVGDKFGRRDIVDAVLMPSATISPGYNTVIVETKAGEEVQGILKQSTGVGLQLMGADGKLVSMAKEEIKEQRGSSLSLMPEGLQAGLSVQEFTDLTEYLTTLKQPENTLASNHGMPMEIPQIAKPVV
ncbi:MAG: c-type cytochrome, partial [Verrucomicrobiota bacterium]